ncbi:MAG: hypothetical protein DCF15_08760 [Phormidesmis priestleyi]|uniref:Uncharacterized protein n=1 Tax=Phormidesmis priestleyi TaxID=268141 RepID=A0A2W4ZCL5_9CYAN|nr:MAG: hypothetical protein DCF15_08760 [Phormidesmis priestleyi]
MGGIYYPERKEAIAGLKKIFLAIWATVLFLMHKSALMTHEKTELSFGKSWGAYCHESVTK